MSSRYLAKTGPQEKLGNFCRSGDAVQIIEYSDMPRELAELRDASGQLVYIAGSPAIHMLRRSFVEHLTATGRLELPLHRATKKVPHILPDGTVVKPDEPNAVKLEMFVFDALPLARNPLILEANRNEQFAPVKNVEGVDSIQSSRALIVERAARWLEVAGVHVPRAEDRTPDCVIELSPRRFLDVDDVLAATGLEPVQSGAVVCFE